MNLSLARIITGLHLTIYGRVCLVPVLFDSIHCIRTCLWLSSAVSRIAAKEMAVALGVAVLASDIR